MTSTVPVWQAELSKASTRGKNIMMMVCITPPSPLLDRIYFYLRDRIY